jgi:hypothetical protein
MNSTTSHTGERITKGRTTVRRITFFIILVLVPIVTGAQVSTTTYGKPEEMKGLTRVFVDTGGDFKNRERIQKEIQSANLGLELLDSADGAQIIILFGGDKVARIGGGVWDGTGGLHTKTYNTGTGQVLVIRDGKSKIVIGYDGEETHMWEKKPATSFGRKFVQAYKKANGLK